MTALVFGFFTVSISGVHLRQSFKAKLEPLYVPSFQFAFCGSLKGVSKKRSVEFLIRQGYPPKAGAEARKGSI